MVSSVAVAKARATGNAARLRMVSLVGGRTHPEAKAETEKDRESEAKAKGLGGLRRFRLVSLVFFTPVAHAGIAISKLSKCAKMSTLCLVFV